MLLDPQLLLWRGRHRNWRSSQWIREEHRCLPRTELVFERRLDVGVDQELHGRREAVAVGTERKRERGRVGPVSPLIRSAVDLTLSYRNIVIIHG